MQDIEALLQKEEDLQKAEELANADAVAAEAAAEIKQDACDIRAAPSMDLCSTEEMMQVFNEYYEGDIQDMSRSIINITNIQASIDVKAAAAEFDLLTSVAMELPDMDFGTSDANEWNVQLPSKVCLQLL